MPKELLSPKEFAEKIGVSKTMVLKYIRNGQLRDSVFRPIDRYFIDPETAERELHDNLNPIRRRH